MRIVSTLLLIKFEVLAGEWSGVGRQNQIEREKRRLDERRLVRATKSIGLSAVKRDPRLLVPRDRKEGKKKNKKKYTQGSISSSHVRTFARKSLRCSIPIISCQRDSRFLYSTISIFCLIFRKAAAAFNNFVCRRRRRRRLRRLPLLKGETEKKKSTGDISFVNFLPIDRNIMFICCAYRRRARRGNLARLSLHSLCIA